MSNEPQPGDEVLEALERERKSAADKLNKIYWILYIILLYFCRYFVGKWKDKIEFETVWRNDFKQQDPSGRTSKEKNFLLPTHEFRARRRDVAYSGLCWGSWCQVIFMVSSIKRWSLPLLVYPVCMIIILIIRLDILFEAGMGMHFAVYGLIQLFFRACACGRFVQIRSKMYVKGEDGRVRYVGPLGVNEYLPCPYFHQPIILPLRDIIEGGNLIDL